MSAIQLSFSTRFSGAKTIHLLGSWDNYTGQLPLAKDRDSGKGCWKGTFKFQGSTLQAGQRYWYYYIIDGYSVSHDPAQASTVEPTTGRALNILDVPSKSGKSSSSSKHSSKHSTSKSKRASADIPKGRPLSVSQIQSPKPVNPSKTKHILENYSVAGPTIEELTSRFSSTTVGDYDYDYEYTSSPSSVGSTISDSSGRSSPSEVSSASGYSSTSSACTCERYGITRKGDRVRLDCGGSVCGYSDADSCSSDECDDDYVPRSTRRQGVVIRR
jgi:hypothetical protein